MKKKRSCLFHDLNLLDYKKALNIQLNVLKAKINNRHKPDQLFFVEHPPVFTLGRRGGRENLMVSEDFLHSRGIEVIQTDRGGNITFHGPGQAILYPIIDLERSRLGVADFVYGMEEIMKQTVHEFGILADRSQKNHGLWVGDKKIGSVGLSIKRGISIHGLALNICPDLTPFSWINPCGLANVAMTSIALEQDKKQPEHRQIMIRSPLEQSALKQTAMERVCQSFIHHFSTIFNFTVSREKPCVIQPIQQ